MQNEEALHETKKTELSTCFCLHFCALEWKCFTVDQKKTQKENETSEQQSFLQIYLVHFEIVTFE